MLQTQTSQYFIVTLYMILTWKEDDTWFTFFFLQHIYTWKVPYAFVCGPLYFDVSK